MAKIFKPTSQYYVTPIRDFYLDIWQQRPIPATESDEIVTLEPKYEKRPDLLAYDLYGTPRLWWVFAVRNPDLIIDPVEDFVAGLEFFAPAQAVIENLE